MMMDFRFAAQLGSAGFIIKNFVSRKFFLQGLTTVHNICAVHRGVCNTPEVLNTSGYRSTQGAYHGEC